MVRVSSPAKLRPWSELTAKMVMGVVPGLVKSRLPQNHSNFLGYKSPNFLFANFLSLA